MRSKRFLMVFIFSALCITLSACNLPEKQANQAQIPGATLPQLSEASPTPISLCANPYYPNQVGATWEYSGQNNAIGAYTRTDSITNLGTDSFTVSTMLANTPSTTSFACNSSGLIVNNPIQQYAGAILNSPDSPVQVQLSSNSGVTLPGHVNPGDTWQQISEGKVSTQNLSIDGRFVFNFSAVGYEDISVPSGTYRALRVDTSIRMEVSGFHILAGSYEMTSWLVENIGLVKSEGTGNVQGLDFSDELQLINFTPAP